MSEKTRWSTKWTPHPPLSTARQVALSAYEYWLREREDLAPASICNYLSDLHHCTAWYETDREAQVHDCFTPQEITTPTLTRYRAYLQTVQRQKPASVNRSFISLKRYFGWTSQQHFITYDPSVAVIHVGQEGIAPRHLDNQEEQALVAAVTKVGNVRDRVLIVHLLHTGLQAREICRLRRDQVKLGKRSGFLEIMGKRNKYREVPLNATARKVLEEYFATLPPETIFLFPSGKKQDALSERALGYIVKKYAQAAKLPDVSPHDLRHRFGYRMAESVPLHRFAQIMGHESLDTTKLYIQGTKLDLQQAVETIAWT
jgi:integrase/recombinase XerD